MSYNVLFQPCSAARARYFGWTWFGKSRRRQPAARELRAARRVWSGWSARSRSSRLRTSRATRSRGCAKPRGAGNRRTTLKLFFAAVFALPAQPRLLRSLLLGLLCLSATIGVARDARTRREPVLLGAAGEKRSSILRLASPPAYILAFILRSRTAPPDRKAHHGDRRDLLLVFAAIDAAHPAAARAVPRRTARSALIRRADAVRLPVLSRRRDPDDQRALGAGRHGRRARAEDRASAGRHVLRCAHVLRAGLDRRSVT